MFHDHAGHGVDPVAGGQAQGEHGASAGVRGHEPGQPGREAGQHGAGFGGVVRLPVLCDDPAAQIHQGDGGVGDGDVRPGHQKARGVDLDRDVRPAEPLGAGGLRALPDQPAGEQPAHVPADGGRREAGEAGDGGTGDRPVVEDRPEDGAGAGEPAAGPGGGYIGASQRGGAVLVRAADGRRQTLHSVFQVLGGSG